MESWQKSYIMGNLNYLLENTRCNVLLITELRSEGLLSISDEDEINARVELLGKAKLLYDILQTKLNAYPTLTKALYNGKQSGAVIKLLNGFFENGIANPLKLCNIQIDYENILASEVIFYGRGCKLAGIFKNITPADLQEIMSNDQYEKDYINHFIAGREKMNLVFDTIPPSPSYYIPRSISNRLNINPDIFKEDCPDVFVFKGIGRVELTELARRNGTSASRNQLRHLTSRFILLEFPGDWEIIKNISKCPVHLINVENDTNDDSTLHTYILEQTSGHSEILIEYMLERGKLDKEYICEDELLSKTNSNHSANGICICDTPGMGKSLLLARLARKVQQKYPDRMTAFIPLTQLTQALESQFGRNSITEDTALKMVLQQISPSPLSCAILQYALSKRLTTLELFLDGLDEVSAEHFQWTMKFLKTLIKQNKHIKFYITSRPHLRKELEVTLGVVAYDILPFTEKDQLTFLVRFWKQTIPDGDSSKLADFASACLEKIRETLTPSNRDIMGIPLQCYMLADVNGYEACIYSDPDRQSIVPENLITTFFEMYKRFFEQRFCTQTHYNNIPDKDPSEIRLHQSKLKCIHVFKALQLLFPRLAIEYAVHNNLVEIQSSMELFKLGILEERCYANVKTIEFLHRTLAEFLVAEYFVEALFSKNWEEENISVLTKKTVWCFIIRILATGVVKTKGLPCSFDGSWMSYGKFTNSVVVYFMNHILKDCGNVFLSQFLSNEFFSLIKPFQLYEILNAIISHGYEQLFRLIKMLVETIDETLRMKYKTFFTRKAVSDTSVVEVAAAGKLFCLASHLTNVSMVKECYHFFQESLQFDVDKLYRNMSMNVITPLHRALAKADYEQVEFLIHKFPLENRDFLYWCIQNSDGEKDDVANRRIEICKLLLQKFKALLYERKIHKPSQCTGPIAAYKVHPKLLVFLIREGANLFATRLKSPKLTFINFAAQYMSSSNLYQLLEFLTTDPIALARCNGKLINTATFHYILRLKRVEKGFLTMVCGNLAMDINAVDLSEYRRDNFLLSAVRGQNDSEVMKELIDLGIDYKYRNRDGDDALSIAAKLGNMELAQCFLSIGLPINRPDENGKTPLLKSYRKIKMVEYLLQKGADIFAADLNGNTIAHKIAVHYNTKTALGEFVALLSIYDSTGQLFRTQNKMERTPLHHRLHTGSSMPCLAVEALLNIPGTDKNNVDKEGYNLFLSAVHSYQPVGVLETLVESGADYKVASKYGETALNLVSNPFRSRGYDYISSLEWSSC